MAKLSFFLFAINFPQRPRTVFRIAIDGNFQRLSPSLSAGKRGYTSRKEHTCVELKRPFYTSPHEILRAAQASKETNKQRVIHAATFIHKVFLISELCVHGSSHQRGLIRQHFRPLLTNSISGSKVQIATLMQGRGPCLERM